MKTCKMTKFKIGDIVRVETKGREKPVVGIFKEYLSEGRCLILEGAEFWYMRESDVILVRPERHETIMRHLIEAGVFSQSHDNLYATLQECHELYYSSKYSFDGFMDALYKENFEGWKKFQ